MLEQTLCNYKQNKTKSIVIYTLVSLSIVYAGHNRSFLSYPNLLVKLKRLKPTVVVKIFTYQSYVLIAKNTFFLFFFALKCCIYTILVFVYFSSD